MRSGSVIRQAPLIDSNPRAAWSGNAAEQAEKRKNGRTAREWEVALPVEFGPSLRRGVVIDFARQLAERYGCAVDVAVHAPDREGDQCNHHAHLLATTRKLSAGGLGVAVPTRQSGGN